MNIQSIIGIILISICILDGILNVATEVKFLKCDDLKQAFRS